MPKRRTPEERYRENVRKQQRELEEFAAYEVEWAGWLLKWFGWKKIEPTEEEYRAAAFFTNKEYLRKPRSLTLLYHMDKRCSKELPECTKENAFDLLRFKYRKYAEVLKLGGFY